MNRLSAAWKGFCHPGLLDVKDPLTGALTRKEFDCLAERVIKRAKLSGEKISLLFLDIDGLKKINDTEGHSAGDKFIRECAEAISASIRPLDICARWHGGGGDEFVILLPGTPLSGAIRVALRVQNIFPNFSWGGATLNEEHNCLHLMVQQAEELMYQGKKEKKH